MDNFFQKKIKVEFTKEEAEFLLFLLQGMKMEKFNELVLHRQIVHQIKEKLEKE